MKKIISLALFICALTQTVSAQLDLNALKNQSDARARERKTESQQFLSNRNSKWGEFLNSRGEEWEKTIANRDMEWSGFLSDSTWNLFDDFLINEPPSKPKPVVAPDASKDPDAAPVKSEPIIIVEPVEKDTAQATAPVVTPPVVTPPVVTPVQTEPVKEEPKVEPVKEEPKDEEKSETVVPEGIVTEEPVKEEPVTEEPVTEEPTTEEPVKEEPTVVTPPVVTPPVVIPPVVTPPDVTPPAVEEKPLIALPVKDEPAQEDTTKTKKAEDKSVGGVKPAETKPVEEAKPSEEKPDDKKDDDKNKPGANISIGIGVVPGGTALPGVIAALPGVAAGTPPCKPIVVKPGNRQTNVNFYGRKVNLEYDPDLARITEKGINQKAIADFWKKASDSNYTLSVASLLDIKDEANLNDWSYYMLIKDFATDLYKDENLAYLLTWFLLVRSGLDARVGIAENNVILLVPSQTTLYGMSYLNIGGKNYYVTKRPQGGIRTYNADYSAANQFDFAQRKSPELGGTKAQRFVTFKFDGKEYTFGFDYDEDLTKYYSDIPQAQYEIYFDAAPSGPLKESVLNNLRPIVAEMDMPTAVNFLLRFVQLAFPYKTDPDQFGYEKYFYADEVFAYPYCDCEDRSVIYSYLVKELLGKKVVGVEFPGHMATAVESSDLTMDGTRYTYKGETYVIADPTYIRSSVGMCMPDYRGVSPKIHEIQ